MVYGVYSFRQPETGALVEKVQITSVVIIYNPFSGNGRAGREYGKLVKLLQDAKIQVTERKTERAGHATELAEKEAMDGHHAFVVIGGDGYVCVGV